MKLKKGWIVLLTCLLAALVLSACGEEESVPEEEENVLIYAALNPVTNTLENSIARFNENMRTRRSRFAITQMRAAGTASRSN